MRGVVEEDYWRRRIIGDDKRNTRPFIRRAASMLRGIVGRQRVVEDSGGGGGRTRPSGRRVVKRELS